VIAQALAQGFGPPDLEKAEPDRIGAAQRLFFGGQLWGRRLADGRQGGHDKACQKKGLKGTHGTAPLVDKARVVTRIVLRAVRGVVFGLSLYYGHHINILLSSG
jgi:hypothetical protein